ncbi:hypothetical protein PanWU01x14_122770, partial [Parasponia andersonii]
MCSNRSPGRSFKDLAPEISKTVKRLSSLMESTSLSNTSQPLSTSIRSLDRGQSRKNFRDFNLGFIKTRVWSSFMGLKKVSGTSLQRRFPLINNVETILHLLCPHIVFIIPSATVILPRPPCQSL